MAYSAPWWNTGEGIRAAMEANDDTPMGPSVYENYDANLKLLPEPVPTGAKVALSIESVWGRKGLYRASNASGSWVITDRPFGGGEA